MKRILGFFSILVTFLVFTCIFSGLEFPYIDFSNIFKNKGVSYENFLLIDDAMDLKKIENALVVKPKQENNGEFSTLSFIDGHNSINLILDATDVIYSKYYGNIIPYTKTSYDEFSALRQDMPLSEAEAILGSLGTLTKVNYLDLNKEKKGTSYQWGIYDSDKIIKCYFDEDDEIYFASFYGAIPLRANPDENFVNAGYEKLSKIPLGSSIKNAESVLESKAMLYHMGNLESVEDTLSSSSYYRLLAKDPSGEDIFNIELTTDDSGNITKKAVNFDDDFEFNTTAKKLSAYADGIKIGMTYEEVKELMGGDGLLFFAETRPQRQYDLIEPNPLIKYVSSIREPSIKCSNLTGEENDYASHIEIYDWKRSNFQVDVKFVDGKVQSFANNHSFDKDFYDNEYLSNNGTGTLAASLQIDDEIKQKAISLTSNCTTDREKAYVLYDFVSNYIAYDYDIFRGNDSKLKYPEGSLPGANFAYYRGSGVCFDYACLYAAMMMEAGVYVRLIDNEDKSDGSHMWNQYYDMDSKTWIPVDCTWKLYEFYEDSKDMHHKPRVIMEYSNL